MIILPKNCIKTGWKISKWKVKFWNSAIVGPFQLNLSLLVLLAGADPGFSALKKNCAERREARKCLGYFVWKIMIWRQKIIFFEIAEGGAKIFGVFRVKNHVLRQQIIFFPILGCVCPPPWIRPWLVMCSYHIGMKICTSIHGHSLGWNFTKAGDWGLTPPEAINFFWGGGGLKCWCFDYPNMVN